VTATNAGGSKSASSAPSGVITGLPAASTSGGGDTSKTVTSITGPPSGGSGGGTHAASNDKTDTTKPVLTLAFIGGGSLAAGTTLSFSAACPKTEKSCKAKFSLLATLKKPTGKAVVKPVTIATTVATLTSGQKKVLKLKLSSAARAALKRSHTLKVTLSASITDAAGNVTPKETKGITLRWKK
jgi:hypothetical protein